MKKIISIFLLLLSNISIAQNVEWIKSINMNGMKFQHHSSITYQNDNLLIGVKAVDTISPADYLNEIYIKSVDATGNLKWSFTYKPIDSINCSEILLIKSYVNDSICIIVGSCFLSNINNSVYFYSKINLQNRSEISFNLGLTSTFSLTSSRIENNNLLLLKGIGLSSVELMRINLLTNSSTSKQLNISGTYTYFNNYFYSVRDSILADNSIQFTINKLDTNGISVASKLFNTGLKVLSNGISGVAVVYKNENLFIEGTYEYHLSNPTIIGNELNYFLIKINPTTLQETQSFVLSDQFPNEIKSKQEIKFDTRGDNTFIIAKVINDNNLRNVHSFLLNNNGIIWTKKLTEPATNQFHKRFVQGNVINKNNYMNVMSSMTGDVTILNYSLNGTLIDSFQTKLDTNSKSLDVLESIVFENENNINLIGSHVLKMETKPRLYIAKLNYVTTGIDKEEYKSIKIYPNPSSTIVHVDAKDVAIITLYNSLGKKVKSVISTNHLYLNDIPNGIYYLHILTNQNQFYIEKMIVSK